MSGNRGWPIGLGPERNLLKQIPVDELEKKKHDLDAIVNFLAYTGSQPL
jgi:hypothetical protein